MITLTFLLLIFSSSLLFCDAGLDRTVNRVKDLLEKFRLLEQIQRKGIARWKRDVDDAAKECMEKHNPDPDDLVDFRSGKMPETKEGKCFITCILEAEGLTKNGEMDAKGFLTIAGGEDKPAVHKMLEYFIDGCKKDIPELQSEDTCEKGVGVMKCMNSMEKLGEELSPTSEASV